MDKPSLGPPPSERPLEERLDSWKEIAVYLKRDVTTVQRWEKREGMPVHRHLHDTIGSVYASRTELDAWTRTRSLRAGQENGNNAIPPTPPVQPPQSVILMSPPLGPPGYAATQERPQDRLPGRGPGIYLFDAFTLDEESFCLTRNGQRVPLEPKSLRVLLLLVKSEGRLLEKNTILEIVWKDTFVEEATLTRAIALLRKQLGDDPRRPQFIETVPTRGYRFIATVESQQSGTESAAAVLAPGVPVTEQTPADPSQSAQTMMQLGQPPSHGLATRRAFLWTAAAALVAGGGMWLDRSLGRKRRSSAVSLVLPLPLGAAAADPGRLLGPPVVAPDGSAVVVSLKTETGESLFIRRLDTDHLVKIEGTQNAEQPFWSPDSQHIGFFADAKLKRIPVIGGSAVVLCDAPVPRGGSWGQNRTIVFGLNFQAIFKVPESGGPSAPVTQLDKVRGENSHRAPIFLPNGRSFLYFARTDDPDQRAIYLGSLDQPQQRQRILVADGQFTLGRDPETETYYLLSQQSGKIALQPFNIESGKLEGSSAILLDSSGTISVSETGVLAIRSDEQTTTRLLWLDRTGKELGTLGTPDDYWSISVSPDGGYAATTKHDYLTGQFRIWVASLQTGLFEPLSNLGHTDAPVWSRDGSSLYYTDVRRRQFFRKQIPARDPNADKLIIDLPKDKFVTVTDISPNQRFAAADFATDNAHSEVAWIELDPTIHSAKPWHFVGASGPEGLLPSFSPDGRWLAFASRQAGNLELYVVGFPPSNSESRRISLNGGHTPRWRRDGKELFFLAGDSGLMSADFSTPGKLPDSPPTLLFHVVPRLATNEAVFDVSPDGRRFLLIDGRDRIGESEIKIILNWPSLLYR